MKVFFIPIILLFVTTSAFAGDAQKVCAQLKPHVTSLQKQLPIEVDYMTTLVGSQVLYLGERCTMNSSYVINSEALLKDVMAGNELSKKENIEYLQSDEGYQNIKSYFDGIAKNTGSAKYQKLSTLKNLTITATYKFDDHMLPPIVSLVMKN